MLPKKPKNKMNVYLDNAATTRTDSGILEIMNSFVKDSFANPSSIYTAGVEAKKALNSARELIAENLKTNLNSIIFTGSGSESNNLAILGTIRKNFKKGDIITTEIEHHSVLEPIKKLKEMGFKVRYLPVDENGLISLKDLKNALNKNTVLVSIMYSNNEVGTIQPIAEIGKMILRFRKHNKDSKVVFHTDACQAVGALDLAVEKLHVDLMTMNGSKIYGPKGVGVLFKRRGLELEPLIYGGKQEMGYRAGTENTPGIVGVAIALDFANENLEKNNLKIKKVRDYFWKEISTKIKDVKLNGAELEKERLVNNLNVSFGGLSGESLMFYLDQYGISCSTGSACTSETEELSHVLKACGYSNKRNLSSVRFSLGKNTTKKEIDYVMKFLPEIVLSLREVEKLEK
ncbi:MAG: cysteine desulfurase NifS [Candidatus Magasanikbacteria bacterium CG_4_9_14_3_um_filter_32_9]|uniref:Cysteine desulfurase NifS n=1 Tax=Candidatus Magasanikbacteria bacterium CG_4_9_14_3_um_filter_32_9 TaxID=1974644 RepID=A0A2M7Z6Z9_9BACT|nr:MAG: cysteine desulfurase NifS [Candidatus Magasanikbacteria bacterium CG_4_9_14_3_um_filter_32_9]